MLKKILLITLLLQISSIVFAIDESKLGINYYNDPAKLNREFSDIYYLHRFDIGNDFIEYKINAGYDSQLILTYMNKLNRYSCMNVDYYPRNGAFTINIETSL